jgi:hypothetical protein
MELVSESLFHKLDWQYNSDYLQIASWNSSIGKYILAATESMNLSKYFPLCTLFYIPINIHLHPALASYTFTLRNNIFHFNKIIIIHNTRHRMSICGCHKLMTFTQLQWLRGRRGYALCFSLDLWMNAMWWLFLSCLLQRLFSCMCQ